MPRSFAQPLAMALAGSLAAGAMAQTAPPAEEPTFFESIDVNIVNIEVYVTDRQGKRVEGLTRDDFQVLEDGKPAEITNFYAVSEGRAAEPAAGSAEVSDGAVDAVSPAPEEQRLHLALFLDNHSLDPANRNRILESVKGFASRLHPDDRVLLATYDGSLEIRQELTGDPALLMAALEQVARVSAGGPNRDADRRQLLRQLDMADALGGGGGGGENQRGQTAPMIAEQLYYDIQSYGKQQNDETRRAIDSMEALVDALAGLPGRKAVLYVSGGISLRPTEALLQVWERKFGTLRDRVGYSPFDAGQNDSTRLFNDLIDHANANRVTFYTIAATTEMASQSAESGGLVVYNSEMEATERMNLQSPMQMIANGTGGIAGVDGPERVLIEHMREDFDSFYSLGYVPLNGKDGKRRSVQVKTRDRSLVVRHREARRERTERERMTARAQSILLLGGEDENPLEVALEMGKERRNNKGQIEVELLVKFPLARLVLLPQDQFHEGHLSVFLGVRDSHGRSSPIQEIDVPIRVPNDQLLTALGQTAAWRTTLLLRPEAHLVAVAVRDRLGNVESTTRVEYTPSPTEVEPESPAKPAEGAPGG